MLRGPLSFGDWTTLSELVYESATQLELTRVALAARVFRADKGHWPADVAELQAAGYQIHRVAEYLPAYVSDVEIIELARQEGATIVTQDLDFSGLIAQSGLNQPSIISLRVGDAKPRVISRILKTALPLIEGDLVGGAIVSVEETQFRVRKLPI